MLPGEEIIHVLPQEFKIDGQSEIKSLLACMVED
jgi:cell division protein FtsA